MQKKTPEITAKTTPPPGRVSALPYRPCVGLVVLNPAGLIWAGQRIDTAAEAWQMPQGGIDKGEAPTEAALRELGEETGLGPDKVSILRESPDWIPYDLPHDLAARLWRGRYRGQTQKWFALRFTGVDADIDIATETPEFREWAWLTPERLIEMIVPFKRPTYHAVFEEFRDLLG